MQHISDVVLVIMPYANVDGPSIGLGYLAAALAQVDIKATVIHGNLLFADKLGLSVFDFLNSSSNIDLLGEWTFAGAAFPDFHSSPDDYFRALQNKYTAEQETEIRRARSLAAAFVNELADQVLAKQPRMVGCSSTFQQNTASLALLRRIRELDPQVITVMGGANCETEVGRALHSHFPWVDYVFSGECDELFPKFCRRLFFGVDSDPLAAGEVWPPASVFTPETRRLGVERPAGLELIKDLNHLPLPTFDDYFRELGASGLVRTISPHLIMETSRGCWWGEKHKCRFCGLSAGIIGFRSKSPDVAYREIDQLFEKYRVRHFELVDNIMDQSYYDTLLPRLANDHRQFRFFYEIKTNVTRRQVELLANAGVAWVQPGIEGLNDRLLKLMRKGNAAYQNLRLLKWAREYGVYVMWSYLCKVPGELDEWHAEELAMIPLLHHLQAPWNAGTPIRFDRFSIYRTHPEEFGLELVPSRAYPHIYPLDDQQLREQAYFFENQRAAAINDGRPQPLMTRLVELMIEWRKAFYLGGGDKMSDVPNEEGPELRMTDGENGHIVIADTRPCAVYPRMELSGLAAEVYRICDPGETAKTVLVKVRGNGFPQATAEQVDGVLADLIREKTMLFVSGRYLSLAVQWPYRPYQSMDLLVPAMETIDA